MKEFADILKQRDITPEEAEEICVRIKGGEDASEWMRSVLDALKSGRMGNFISSFPAFDKRYEVFILQIREMIPSENRILGAMTFNIDPKRTDTAGLEIIPGSEDGFTYTEIVSDRFGIIGAVLRENFDFSKKISYRTQYFYLKYPGKELLRSCLLKDVGSFSLSLVEGEKIRFLWHVGIPIAALREDFRFVNPSFRFRGNYEYFLMPESKLTREVLYGISCHDLIRAAKQNCKVKDVPEILFAVFFEERMHERQEETEDEWLDLTI
jgi:hypothetical protein